MTLQCYTNQSCRCFILILSKNVQQKERSWGHRERRPLLREPGSGRAFLLAARLYRGGKESVTAVRYVISLIDYIFQCSVQSTISLLSRLQLGNVPIYVYV